eukprot:m.366331 g.366331  ORF g.366331 m.366331 type:complete len:639 (+) comp16659_c0_seq2:1827-3743(+)
MTGMMPMPQGGGQGVVGAAMMEGAFRFAPGHMVPYHYPPHQQFSNMAHSSACAHVDTPQPGMALAGRGRPKPSTSYRGVSITPSGKYRASVSFGGRRYHLGMFASAEEAARAYDRKAIELGITDRLNMVDAHDPAAHGPASASAIPSPYSTGTAQSEAGGGSPTVMGVVMPSAGGGGLVIQPQPTHSTPPSHPHPASRPHSSPPHPTPTSSVPARAESSSPKAPHSPARSPSAGSPAAQRSPKAAATPQQAPEDAARLLLHLAGSAGSSDESDEREAAPRRQQTGRASGAPSSAARPRSVDTDSDASSDPEDPSRQEFRPEEDAILKRCHQNSNEALSGVAKWTSIAKQLPGRDADAIRRRWGQLFGHRVAATPNDNPGSAAASPLVQRYTEGENRVLLEAHGRLGNNWGQIASLLPGRNPQSIRAQYRRLRRKRKRTVTDGEADDDEDEMDEDVTGRSDDEGDWEPVQRQPAIVQPAKRSRGGGDNSETSETDQRQHNASPSGYPPQQQRHAGSTAPAGVSLSRQPSQPQPHPQQHPQRMHLAQGAPQFMQGGVAMAMAAGPEMMQVHNPIHQAMYMQQRGAPPGHWFAPGVGWQPMESHPQIAPGHPQMAPGYAPPYPVQYAPQFQAPQFGYWPQQ